jgi:hypothetical protein
MLAVYDCMLFFRAASRPQRVQPLFELVDQAHVTLCLSAEVVAEIRDVLIRPKLLTGPDFRRRFAVLQIVTPPAFLAVVARSSP